MSELDKEIDTFFSAAEEMADCFENLVKENKLKDDGSLRSGVSNLRHIVSCISKSYQKYPEIFSSTKNESKNEKLVYERVVTFQKNPSE